MSDEARESTEERLARLVVSSILDLEVRSNDPGGGALQRADYLIIDADGRAVPMEVTAAADFATLASHGARQKLDWTTPGLRADWMISLSTEWRVNELYRQRYELLAELEMQGIEELRVDGRDALPPDSVGSRLRALGVRAMKSVGDAGSEGAQIYFGWTTVGSVAPIDVADAVAVEAWRHDNRAKLTPAGHLFVWVGSTKSDANAAMSFGLLPDGLDAPPELSCAWVAPGPYADVSYLASPLWRWTPDDGWEDLGRIDSA